MIVTTTSLSQPVATKKPFCNTQFNAMIQVYWYVCAWFNSAKTLRRMESNKMKSEDSTPFMTIRFVI